MRGKGMSLHALGHFEQSLAAVATTGLDAAARLDLIAMVDDYVAGFVLKSDLEPALEAIPSDIAKAAADYLDAQLQIGHYLHTQALLGTGDRLAGPGPAWRPPPATTNDSSAAWRGCWTVWRWTCHPAAPRTHPTAPTSTQPKARFATRFRFWNLWARNAGMGVVVTPFVQVLVGSGCFSGHAVNTYCMPDSRAALLAAAAEEFARHGPKGARIQAIVQLAGVNERMIYHHFGSKDGLYAAVLEAQANGLVQAWRQVIDTAAELAPYEGMRTALAGFADAFAARPLMVALTLHEALGWLADPAVAHPRRGAVSQAAGAVRARPAPGGVPRRLPV